MWRPVVGGLGLALLLLGCQRQGAPPISKRPAAAGQPPRPSSPASNKGEWQDPRLRELRQAGRGEKR